MNINFFISEIKHYKEINKLSDENKNFIFTINIQRKFDSRKANKLTIILSNIYG
jgi:hypothetical protein